MNTASAYRKRPLNTLFGGGTRTLVLGERLNGIQEVSGSIPLISTISRERTFPRFRKEARFCFLCGNRHDVQPAAELLKVDIEINVQFVVPVDMHPLD